MSERKWTNEQMVAVIEELRQREGVEPGTPMAFGYAIYMTLEARAERDAALARMKGLEAEVASYWYHRGELRTEAEKAGERIAELEAELADLREFKASFSNIPRVDVTKE